MLLSAVLAAALSASPTPAAGSTAVAPQADVWSAWTPLLGRWEADPDPRSPGASGGFTLEKDVQGHALVRRNHADYPAANGRPAAHHEDLMLLFVERGQTRADYVDNEGHVIHYAVEAAPGRIVLLSEVTAGAPRFRFTYSWSTADKLSIAFEIAPPGQPDAFKPYLSATAHRAH